MKRGRLLGVATARKRLVDGTQRKYYYAWRGARCLKGDDGLPLKPSDPQFVVAYAAGEDMVAGNWREWVAAIRICFASYSKLAT